MDTATTRSREQPSKLWLACGVIGPILFVIVFLLEGATRANYSALRQPISSLLIGELGWMQMVNFLVTGLLLLIFALGLRRAVRGTIWGPVLVGLVGIGLMGAGLFVSDPFNGYPPGTPLVPTVRSTHGIIHDLFGVPVFLGLPIACLVFSRRFAKEGERGWAIYSALTCVGMLAAFVLTSMGLNQVAGLADIAGLLQRLTLCIGFTWIVLLALHLLRTRVGETAEHRDDKRPSSK